MATCGPSTLELLDQAEHFFSEKDAELAMNQEIADAMELAKTKEGDQYDPYPLSYDTSLEEFFERTLEKDEKRFARGDMDKVQEKVNMENLKKVQEK